VIITKVVQATNDKQASLKGLWLTSQRTSATSQNGQAPTAGGIEAFDEGGVDGALPLAEVDQAVNEDLAALDDPALDSQGPGGAVFDDLNDGQIRPRSQMAATELALTRQLRAKSALKGPDIAGQAIDGQKQRENVQICV
jgi:hypothetical protein